MIEIKNIKKTFGDKLLFETKEIRFPSTGLIVIKGENGCGKTTFFNMLSFIDTDYEGTVLVDGVDYRKESDAIRSKFRRDNICYILQKQNFISFLSVEKNQGIYSKEKKKGRTGIQELSQGQQEIAVLEEALKLKKRIYFLDEVLSSLDEAHRKEIIKRILELSKTNLVVLVSHDVLIDTYADQIYLFQDKKVELIKERKIEHSVAVKNKECRLNRRRLTISFLESKLVSGFFHFLCTALFSFFVFISCFALANDCYFNLAQGMKDKGYIILSDNKNLTNDDLFSEFGEDCYYDCGSNPLILGYRTIKDDNNLYCNQATYDRYDNVNFDSKTVIKNHQLIKNDVKLYDIIIDNTISENFLFKYSKSDDFSYQIVQSLYYDSDESTKEEKASNMRFNYQFLFSASYFKKKHPSYEDLEFKDDTFYVSDKSMYSSCHVDSFMKPLYNAESNSFIVDYNALFPKGVDTVLLDNAPEENKLKDYIVLSDYSMKKIYEVISKHSAMVVITQRRIPEKAFYIYMHHIAVEQNYMDQNKDYTAYQNLSFSGYSNTFTYSILFVFFFVILLFFELNMYYFLLLRHHHDFFLMYSLGMTKKSIYLFSIVPSFCCLVLSFAAGGILSLLQSGFKTAFLSGIPTALLFLLAFFLSSYILFYIGRKKRE